MYLTKRIIAKIEEGVKRLFDYWAPFSLDETKILWILIVLYNINSAPTILSSEKISASDFPYRQLFQTTPRLFCSSPTPRFLL